MPTPAPSEGQGPAQPGPLPNGLYVRKNDNPDRAPSHARVAGARRWSITGRNPQFWWDIVLSRLDTNAGGFELHCTKCGHRDRASSMDDLLRLIHAGAHLHDTDPAGEP